MSANALGQTYILAGYRYTTLSEPVALIAQAVDVAPPTGRLPLWPLYTAAAVCELICMALKIDPPLHRRRVDFFHKDRAFCIDKAQAELGFDPAVDLEEGLARTAAWYVEMGHVQQREDTTELALGYEMAPYARGTDGS